MTGSFPEINATKSADDWGITRLFAPAGRVKSVRMGIVAEATAAKVV